MKVTLSPQEVVRVVIAEEKSCYALYFRSAIETTSQRVKAILNRMACDKMIHLLALLKKLESSYPELPEETNIVLPPTSDEEVKRLAGVHKSQEAFACAIQKEQGSVRFYRQLMRGIEDRHAKSALQIAIRDDTDHINGLRSLNASDST